MTIPTEPRNMARVRQRFPTYRSRMDYDGEVVVSLCGDVRHVVDAEFVVFADPARTYDWTGLQRLSVLVVVRKGVDALPTVKALWDIAEPYIQILDADTRDEAAVLALYPKLRLWRKRKDVQPLPMPAWKTASDGEKSAYLRAVFGADGWGVPA